jgi:hypothetical protein
MQDEAERKVEAELGRLRAQCDELSRDKLLLEEEVGSSQQNNACCVVVIITHILAHRFLSRTPFIA